MTKADIVSRIQERSGFNLKESAAVVEQVFEIIKSSLEQGNNIKVSGFGNFEVRQKADRRGRNPQTGDEMIITARRVLTFKPSPILKDLLNRRE